MTYSARAQHITDTNGDRPLMVARRMLDRHINLPLEQGSYDIYGILKCGGEAMMAGHQTYNLDLDLDLSYSDFVITTDDHLFDPYDEVIDPSVVKLSCAFCQNDLDKLDKANTQGWESKAAEWMARHKDCEEKVGWPFRKA